MHLAERNLWRAISKLLWAFDITPIIDPATGKPILPNTEPFGTKTTAAGFAGGAVRVAHPFKISIKPRSAKRAEVALREYREILPLLQEYE
jgi:hypothetical protein